MRMGKKKCHLVFASELTARHQGVTQAAKSSTCIDDDRFVLSRLNLDAGRISTVGSPNREGQVFHKVFDCLFRQQIGWAREF